jgi:phospholipase D
MSKKKYGRLFNIIAISLLIGIFIGYVGNNRVVLGFLDDYFKPEASKEINPVLIGSGEVATCFTPPSGCGAVIVNLISKAEESIYVQAYGFTSGEIAKALINASNRGVKVRVLLDKSNIGAKYSKMRDLRKAGIEVLIDEVSGIAHNKIIIIDASLVITGSFNFTTSADIRNTENVIIIKDKQVAQRYLQNWFARYEISHARITKNK